MPPKQSPGADRVVVTGYGAVSALGATADDLERSIHTDRSGIVRISRFDAAGFPTSIAAEIPAFDANAAVGEEIASRTDRFVHLALASASEAMAMARLARQPDNERWGVLIGSALGGVETLYQATTAMLGGMGSLVPDLFERTVPSAASAWVAQAFGAQGPVFAPASAFTSSANAIGEGMRMIETGRADVMIVGGSEAPVCPTILAGFASMTSLSANNTDPGKAVKPFDLYRDGCAIGEGSAVLVLERESRARTRGAPILAVASGYGVTADAFHEVQIAPGATGIVDAMRDALDDARLAPGRIGYLNAHGTGTAMNDAYETHAIKKVFGDHALHLPVSGTKSRTGHLLGAAGALEAVISIQAMRGGYLPYTLNLEHPDPQCDLDFIPCTSRSIAVSAVMSTSMGFGGHNTALVFTAP